MTAGATLLMVGQLVVSSSWAATFDGRRIRQDYAQTVVYIEREFRDSTGALTRKPAGTGFIVHDKGWVLTNDHVARYAADPGTVIWARVGRRNNPEQPLILIKREPELDLALLRLPELDPPGRWQPAPVGDSNTVAAAQPLFVLGFPLGKDLQFTDGKVRQTNADKGMIATDTAVNPGNSGGPVFDDNSKVVAVVHGGIESAQNLNFLIPINHARGLLILIGPGW